MTKIQITLLFGIFLWISACSSAVDPLEIYVGTYADSTHSSGVFQIKAAENSWTTQAIGSANYRPSYLHLDSATNRIWGVSENGTESGIYLWEQGFEGLVNAPVFFPFTAKDPCFITTIDGVSVTASYSSGATLVAAETSAMQTLQHHGSSVNTARQEQSHLHMILPSKSGNYVFATDLGADKIYAYQWDRSAKRIKGVAKSTPAPLGSGPRFMALHPKLNQLYVLTELEATLLRFQWNEEDEFNLSFIDSTPLHELDWEGDKGASHLAFSADGNFLYAADRGSSNEIMVFEVAADGSLSKLQTFALEGKGPRHFALNKQENVLIVAQQLSNEVEFIKRDNATGKLLRTFHKEKVASPSCILVKPL